MSHNKMKTKYFTQSLRKICIEERNNVTSDCITYRNKQYKKLFPFCFETLHFDLIVNDDFYLATFIDNGIEYIIVAFSTKPRRKFSTREERLRILSMVFNDVQDYDIDQPQLRDEISNERDYYITYKLYEMLREQHSSNPILPRMANDEEYPFLKPVLREYQKAAVRWLLTRENAQDKISGIFHPVSCRDIPENIFYLNNITLDLYSSKPAEITVPSGGILADEMGLGKTVEMLALILSNTRNLPTVDMSDDNIPEKRVKQNENIFCICPKKRKIKLINCVKCNVLQHSHCVRNYSTDSDHICPDCWEKMGIYESGATIIVSPEPIKMQWYSEIMKHSNKPLKILLYTGIQKMKWISPAELAKYDIVLTDYSVLQGEIYFANGKPTRTLRAKKAYMQVTTPLVMVRWWRVCLDEAQMVKATTRQSNSSQMVKNLPAIHRWAVTGTPIQKSIEDLRGLLDFLDLTLCNENKVFANLVNLFQHGCTKPLLNILSKVMWRTCKVSVLDQLDIPPQTEEVRYVTLSDAERLHYQSQHQLCFASFEERVRNLASSSSTSKINPRTLQMLLEPLRKLRQDCTVPVLLQKSDESVVKKLLQPAELLEHLRVTNEIDCKTRLRTIASSYNGIGALHFIRGEFEEATKCYEAVLRRAKDYTGTISVDSLLQIHALDNLLKAHEANIAVNDANIYNVEQIQVYRNQCDKLEWKYIETYRSNLTKAQEGYNTTFNAVNELRSKFPTHTKTGMWWRNILYSIERSKCSDQLFARINDEKRSSYSSSLLMDFYSRQAIDYTLTIWSDNLFKSRNNVIQAFNKFKPFINNVKPKDDLNEETQKLLKLFVKNTFDCHLKEILNDKINDEESSIEESPAEIVLCKLCEAKRALADLECKLFNKQLDVRTEKVRGVENPSLQETILKIICIFAKAKDIGQQDVKDGEMFLQLIENMKKEYKEFGKVWIETEYTVKAYDELDMCKLRLQAIDPENLKQDKNKLIYNISKEEIDLMFDEFKFNLKTAELEFVRKSSRLKYLQHLEKQSDPEICPICTTLPESRYCMLECGHHMCLSCLAALAKYGAYIKCSICRNRQKYQDVYFVTHKVNEFDGITFKGFYSSKIEVIVRNVIKLIAQDENVKILIFSQWEGILTVISNALIENGVKIKQRKSTKNVDEFKDPKLGITCLLLLLSHGSKGLNLVEATHVFLVEPILNPGEELQVIGRVHRIGQTKPTIVHRFISKDTVEETIFDTVYADRSKKWELKNVTIDNIRVLLSATNTFQPMLEMTID